MNETQPDPGELLAKADRLLAEGSIRQAEAIYRDLAARFPRQAVYPMRLGILAANAGQHDAARRFLEIAIRLAPQDAQARIEHALALRELGRPDEAIEDLHHALRSQPGNARAMRYMGVVLMEMGKFDEAVAAWNEGLQANPRFVSIHCDLGMLLGDLGRTIEATACFDRALALEPGHPRARAMKGELLLAEGRYAEGWELFEGRLETRARTTLRQRSKLLGLDGKPRWTGVEPLEGRTLLVHPEAGLGDLLMFARYIPVLEKAGARVVVHALAPLAGLLRSSFPAAAIAAPGEPLPRFDFHCPIMSLPAILGTTLETIPGGFPYLAPDTGKLAEWTQRIGPPRGARIGLVWAGQARDIDRSPLRRRSMGLDDVAPLLELPCEFHVLQKEVSEADRQSLAPRTNVRLHDGLATFEDTAALAHLMDEVVTIDTSVAHLAGGLGKRMHVIVAPACDYRWGRAGARSPWYPAAAVHRRSLGGTWREPVETIRNHLSATVSRTAA